MTAPATRLRVFIAEYGDTLAPGVGKAVQALVRATLEDAAKAVCPLCRDGVPHHTNAAGSIGGNDHRRPVWDLHISTGGGLEECIAYPIWVLRG